MLDAGLGNLLDGMGTRGPDARLGTSVLSITVHLRRPRPHEPFSRQDAKKRLDRVSAENAKAGRGFGSQLALSIVDATFFAGFAT